MVESETEKPAKWAELLVVVVACDIRWPPQCEMDINVFPMGPGDVDCLASHAVLLRWRNDDRNVDQCEILRQGGVPPR